MLEKQADIVLTNKQGKKIYCWDLEEEYIFSLKKLNEENGKFRSVKKEDERILLGTLNKLGVNNDDIEKFKGSDMGKSIFYNDVPSLKEERLKLRQTTMAKVGAAASNKTTHSNIRELSFLAGVQERADFQEEVEIPHQSQRLWDNNVQIPDRKPRRTQASQTLKEGKADRVILGKTSVTAQSNGLFKIEVENVPGVEEFQADLYKSIIGYLNDKLSSLKERNPDVAALEQSTEGELSGKKEAEGGGAGAGEIDLGFEEPPAEGAMPAEGMAGEMGGAAAEGMAGEGALGAETPTTPTM